MATDTGKALARTGLVFGLGTAFGAPGYIIGGVLGTVLFPPDPPEAPDPYTSVNAHSASSKIPIALCYGTVKHQGNMIYKGPLRYEKVEEGGKGGQKTVTGYKYWTSAGIGVCRGPVEVTRMWKDDEQFVFESDSTVTVHRGYPDQTIDPDFDALVDQAVPYKNLAWIGFWDFYLGEDNNTFPVMSSEVHNYPADITNMPAAYPTIFNKVDEQNDGSIGGFIMKDKFDEYIQVNWNTSEKTVKVYNAQWELQRTIDISRFGMKLNGWQDRKWDACLVYKGGDTFITIISAETHTYREKMVAYQFKKTIKDIVYASDPTGRTTVLKNEWGLGEWWRDVHCCANASNIFVVARGLPHVWKLSANNPANMEAEWTYFTQISSPEDITCNHKYFFVMETGGSNVHLMNQTTGAILDTAIMPNSGPDVNMGGSIAMVAKHGGPHVIFYSYGNQYGGGPTDYEDGIVVMSYDETTEQWGTTARDAYAVNPFWDNGLSPFRENAMVNLSLYEGPDGTIIASGDIDNAGTGYVMNMIIDANPACIIWDLMTNIREIPILRIDSTALETIAGRCLVNRIGMSFRLINKKNVGAVVRDILGHLQGQPFRNNYGQFSFFMPSADDSPEDEINLEDVVVSQNDGAPDWAIVQTTNKDIGLCPNRLNVTFTNRLNGYKQDATFQLDDMLSQDVDGELVEEDLAYNFFSNGPVVAKLAWKAWKISRFQNRMHEILLNGRWLWVQPGMVLTLNIPEEDLNDIRVRVFSVDDPPIAQIGNAAVKVTFQMDDDYLTSYEEIQYDPSLAEDTSVGPPVEVTPIIWEEDARYNNDTPAIGLTAIRTDDATAYCDVYISLDAPDSWVYAGRMTQFANVGDLVGDLTKDERTITVDTGAYEGSTFPAYTRTNQRNGLSYCLIGYTSDKNSLGLSNLEFMTYRDVVPGSGDQLILRRCVRGKDYTLSKEHDSADNPVVLHVGRSYFKKVFEASWIGKTIYVKCIPANAKGKTLDFDEVATWEYSIQGYTWKATHCDRLEIEDSTRGPLGSRNKTTDSDVKVIWEYTNRNSGMGESTLEAWEWQGWQAGDVDDYDVIVYQSDGETIQAEHLGIGLVDNYTYLNATNIADFGGGGSSHFWLGVRPVVTGRGPGRGVPDIMKQEVIRV